MGAPPQNPKAHPGDVIAGKYRIQGVLGRGGMGVVFSAIHEVTSKPLALKWLTNPSTTARQRLIREAQAAGRIDHPNVVDVYDVGEHDGDLFLVMEWLRGMPLEALVKQGAMSGDDAIRMLMPAMRGVAAAHALGVIHRDLKPDNIFLCESSDGSAMTVKVLDFGISKVVSAEDMKLTGQGQVIGTPLYMAPEQLLGKEVGIHADIYALGCILYEMVEGEPAFDAESFEELATRKVTSALREFVRAPARMQEVIRRAVAEKPSQRFQTISEFAEALEPFAGGRVQFSDSDTDWASVQSSIMQLVRDHTASIPRISEALITTPRPAKRVPVATVAITAALAAAAVAAVIALRRAPEPEVTQLPTVAQPSMRDAGATPAVKAPPVVAEPVEIAPSEPAVRRTMRARPRMTSAPAPMMFRSGTLSEDEF